MWNDFVQAGIPKTGIDGITTSEMFPWWQKLEFTQKSRPPPASPPTPRPPSTLPDTSVQDAARQQKQYTLQVLPQGCKLSPSICHLRTAADLAAWLGTVTVYHYSDDQLIMVESQQESEAAAELLKVHLQDRDWANNPKKIQGPGATLQFWGIVCHGQIRKIPNQVQQAKQPFPVPITVKQLQTFGGLLGDWRTFIPHLVILICLWRKLTRKKVVWQGTKQQQEAFDACKDALTEHAQLYTPKQGYSFELVTIPDDTVSGLWQMTGMKNQKEPVGFWSKALQGSAIHHNPTSLILHPLLISNSRVFVFQVSLVNTCASSRGDSIGMLLLVLQTQHRIEVHSEKAQAIALQSVWAITPHQVIKPEGIVGEGAGAARMYHWEDMSLLFSSPVTDWLIMLCSLVLQAHALDTSLQNQRVNTQIWLASTATNLSAFNTKGTLTAADL
uniref:ribonuclease H n=1 Tax=Calidris pygmaea TaxID=425635 RepID=A0A8C3K197_9CHAR